MDWKEYEDEIYRRLCECHPHAEISKDVRLEGKYSGVNRQIDVLIEETVSDNIVRTVVDGKFYSKKVDVKDIEMFISMVQDVGGHRGLLITQKGFSQAAINRAYKDPLDVEIDVLNFEELMDYQGECAFPYADNNTALLTPPFGWVIDAQRYDAQILAHLYQRGFNLVQAQDEWEFMYVNFWDRIKGNESLEDLLKAQEGRMVEAYEDISFEYDNSIERGKNEKVLIRKAESKNLPGPEFTGFIEFENFIFFCVLHTKHEFENRNLSKMKTILRTLVPGNIEIRN